MKKAYQAMHEMETTSILFSSNKLRYIGEDLTGVNQFELLMPTVYEPVPFEDLVTTLRPQFDTQAKTQRFVDDMLQELRRQQLADAIAQMIQV